MPFVVADKLSEPLYAIVPYQNAWRWKSREKHTIRAIKHFMDSGAVVYLVEAAFNRRDLTFADSGIDGLAAQCGIQGEGFKHRYIPLRSSSELWLKENMINVAATMLPWDWKQVCWLDSDVHFLRPNWVGECIHKLQHYSVLQMFSQARDLGPNYEMLPEEYPHASGVSFVQSWKDGDLAQNLSWGKAPAAIAQKEAALSAAIARSKELSSSAPLGEDHLTQLQKEQAGINADIAKLKADLQTFNRDEYYYGGGKRRVFPGLAWAMTRKAWDDVGGLLDFAIWGGGDWHMSHALVDKTDGMMHTGLNDSYKKLVSEWHGRAQQHIRQNLGVIDGTIVHHWHGKKTVRGYGDKHRILAKAGFDPLRHLKKDYQGLHQLHDDGSDTFTTVRDEMRRIAKERNEDSIDT